MVRGWHAGGTRVSGCYEGGERLLAVHRTQDGASVVQERCEGGMRVVPARYEGGTRVVREQVQERYEVGARVVTVHPTLQLMKLAVDVDPECLERHLGRVHRLVLFALGRHHQRRELLGMCGQPGWA